MGVKRNVERWFFFFLKGLGPFTGAVLNPRLQALILSGPLVQTSNRSIRNALAGAVSPKRRPKAQPAGQNRVKGFLVWAMRQAMLIC